MSLVSTLKYLHLLYCSQPANDRALYRRIPKSAWRNILEMGIGSATRAMRLIDVARRTRPIGEIAYTGIDLFEGRQSPDAEGISLREAYKRLKSTGAAVRLVPGDPFSALSYAANKITNIDLLLISADQDAESLAKAWLYVPRMLAEGAVVFWEKATGPKNALIWQPLSQQELQALAGLAARRPRRRAA